MHIVQLLLPLNDNEGTPLPRDLFASVRQELVDRFGGLTAYTRAPARGLWDDDRGDTRKDDLVIYEVMLESLDVAWWGDYRMQLEARFAQQSLVVRTQPITLL
jgi:hypothetical protein